MLDYHVILDLLPTIASLYFDRRLGADVRLSAVQSSIFLAMGLQRKSVEDIEVLSNLYIRDTLADKIIDRVTASCLSNPSSVRQSHSQDQQEARRYSQRGYQQGHSGGQTYHSSLQRGSQCIEIG